MCLKYNVLRFQDQYYELSDDPEGCKPCDCDVGGAIDNMCDQQTGQCKCRPNIIGRRCDQPQPGFFIPYLDYYTYEGEFGEGSDVSASSILIF